MAIRQFLTPEEYKSSPETTKAFYVPQGDRYSLDVEGEENLSGLKSALKAVRNENRMARDLQRRLVAERDGALHELGLVTAAIRAGVVAVAIPDVLGRAKDEQIKPEGLNEWLSSLQTKAPHLF